MSYGMYRLPYATDVTAKGLAEIFFRDVLMRYDLGELNILFPSWRFSGFMQSLIDPCDAIAGFQPDEP
jgi:hypothetical protein